MKSIDEQLASLETGTRVELTIRTAAGTHYWYGCWVGVATMPHNGSVSTRGVAVIDRERKGQPHELQGVSVPTVTRVRQRHRLGMGYVAIDD